MFVVHPLPGGAFSPEQGVLFAAARKARAVVASASLDFRAESRPPACDIIVAEILSLQ